MAKRVDILSMTPTEAFDQASRDGYRNAEKLTASGLKPEAFPRWLKGRPEYNNQDVLSLVRQGEDSFYEAALAKIAKMPNSSRILVWNLAVRP